LWRYRDSQTFEIWRGSQGTLLEPAGVSPDGTRAAILLRRNGKRRLNVISADGAEIRPLSDAVDAEGVASWSPDGKWIVTGGSDKNGPGLFRISADGGTVERVTSEAALHPVVSPDGIIIYGGRGAPWMTLRAVHPNGERVELPPIQLRGDADRFRLMPDGKALVYMQGLLSSQDFWLLDLTTMKTRQLAHLDNPATMQTFDVTPDGTHIVFDRLRQNSDVVLIDLPLQKQ
jgi:Tol biopolymer transport system component